MIERYAHPEIKRIWSDQNKFNLWAKLELTYLEKFLFHKNPAIGIILNKNINIDVQKVKTLEATTKHELVAFLQYLETTIALADIKKFLHYGLTSSDIIDTASVLQIKESFAAYYSAYCNLHFTLTNLADKYEVNGLCAIGRTHGKHAEKILLADRFFLLLSELEYCYLELESAVESLPGKLSGPVGTSSHINPEVAKSTLSEFNLKPIEISTQIIPRHLFAKLTWAIGLTLSVYERFATMIRLSAIDEVNEIQEGFSPGQCGSSAMPHKNNPILSENICGLARLARRNIEPTLQNIPLWWERDISHSSVERVVWAESFHLLMHATTKMQALIDQIYIIEDNVDFNLSDSLVKTSHSDLLNALTSTSRSEAYKVVQNEYNLKRTLQDENENLS